MLLVFTTQLSPSPVLHHSPGLFSASLNTPCAVCTARRKTYSKLWQLIVYFVLHVLKVDICLCSKRVSLTTQLALKSRVRGRMRVNAFTARPRDSLCYFHSRFLT